MDQFEIILTALEDRIAVFEDKKTGERLVAYGDGKVLPFRSFVAHEMYRLAIPYLMSPNSNVTSLDSRQLAGLLGGVLARQSRVSGTIIDVLAKEFLNKDGSVKTEKVSVLERILLQFGDDSVQEYEGATVLFTSVSNLATKFIEDRRLGSYIEQSSRYVVYTERDRATGHWLYYREPRIMESEFAGEFVSIMDQCFETYSRLTEALIAYYHQIKSIENVMYAVHPHDKKEYRLDELTDEKEIKQFERVYTFDIRTRACDTARILLPAATLTNMAMVANGRTFEYCLKRMYSSGNPEFIDIAERMHETLNKTIPTYVRRADPGGEKMWMEIDECARNIVSQFPEFQKDEPADDDVVFLELPKMVDRGDETMAHVLAANLFPYARCSYGTLVKVLRRKDRDELVTMLRAAVGDRKHRRDRSPRAFEHGYDVTVELTGNFGIFRDLHRHRMCTLLRQHLTPSLGFSLPEDVEAVGFGDEVRALVGAVQELYEKILSKLGPDAAQYMVLFGHHIRWIMGFNLREAQHLLELRTIPQGHVDYRRICQKIHRELCRRAPWIDEVGLLKFVDHEEYSWARAAAEARQSQKAMEKGIEL